MVIDFLEKDDLGLLLRAIETDMNDINASLLVFGNKPQYAVSREFLRGQLDRLEFVSVKIRAALGRA